MAQPAKTGLFCFMNADRVCSADCMAFLHPPPAEPDYAGQQWASCLLLVNVHRGGKHLVILASEAHKLAAQGRTAPPGANIPPPIVR